MSSGLCLWIRALKARPSFQLWKKRKRVSKETSASHFLPLTRRGQHSNHSSQTLHSCQCWTRNYTNYAEGTLFAKRVWDRDISDSSVIFYRSSSAVCLFKYIHNTALCKTHFWMTQPIKTTKKKIFGINQINGSRSTLTDVSNLIWKFWTLTFL